MRYFANTLKTRQKFQRFKSFSQIRISQITDQKMNNKEITLLLAFIFSYLISFIVRVVRSQSGQKLELFIEKKQFLKHF